MKNPERRKPIFVDKDGLGRITIPKSWLAILEWEHKDTIQITCDLDTEKITIRRVRRSSGSSKQ